VAVYRKALFRDRNQTRKRTLFTLEPRPDALRGVFHQSAQIHAKRLKLSNLGSLEPDNSDTFVSSSLHLRGGPARTRCVHELAWVADRSLHITEGHLPRIREADGVKHSPGVRHRQRPGHRSAQGCPQRILRHPKPGSELSTTTRRTCRRSNQNQPVMVELKPATFFV